MKKRNYLTINGREQTTVPNKTKWEMFKKQKRKEEKKMSDLINNLLNLSKQIPFNQCLVNSMCFNLCIVFREKNVHRTANEENKKIVNKTFLL